MRWNPSIVRIQPGLDTDWAVDAVKQDNLLIADKHN